MPIDYQRDDYRRLITATLTDPYTFDELMSQTDRQWAENTWDYAFLYDSRGSAHVTPTRQLEQLVEHVAIVGAGRLRGPVGVAILPRPEMVRSGLQLAKLTGPLRSLEMLLNQTQVEAWLMRHAPRRESPG